MKMKNLVITGGSGFIGSNLIDHYRNQGLTVHNLDSAPPRNRLQRDAWRKLDILDREALASAFAELEPDWIFHLAARTDMDGRSLDEYRANTDGVRNVLQAAQQAGFKGRMVLASSRLVCRIGYQPVNDRDYCPTTAYGRSKMEGEKIVYAAGDQTFEWFQVRPTSIWGPWFDVPYRNFFDTVRKGLYVHPSGRPILKSYGYVGNAVFCLDKLMQAPREQVQGRMFYLCDYKPLELGGWADLIQTVLGAPRIRRVPRALLKPLALAGDGLKHVGMRNPPLTSFRLNNLTTEMVHDARPLEAICGPLPYSLEQGVEATAQWLRTHGNI